jgi:hypothetical protein
MARGVFLFGTYFGIGRVFPTGRDYPADAKSFSREICNRVRVRLKSVLECGRSGGRWHLGKLY